MDQDMHNAPDSNSLTVSHSQLPSIKEIFVDGYQLFKQNWKPLALVGATYIGMYLLMALIIGGGVVAGVLVIDMSNTPIFTTLIILGIIVFLVFLWLFLWATLTMRYIVANHTQKLTVKESFAATRSLVWPYIWVNILVSLAIFVPVLIIFAVILTVAVFKIQMLSTVVAIIGVFVTIAVLIALGTWFGFTSWTFLKQGARGVNALKESRELSRNRFWAVFGRVIGVGLPYAIGILIVDLVLNLVFSVFGHPVDNLISQVAVNIVNFLFLTPLFLCLHYTIYNAVRKTSV
jgi:MFS family permease